jgi:hypothetical protein
MSDDKKARALAVANTILEQLGGGRFVAMTGAKNLTACDEGLRMKLPGTLTRDRINWLEVKLDPSDTYTLTFACERKPRGKAWAERTVIETVDMVYCDQLRDVFEQVTGLVTSL